MRPASLTLVLMFGMASSCSHTETVARQDDPAAAQEQEGKAASAEPGEGKSAASEKKTTSKARRERDPADARGPQRNDGNPSDEDEPPPLATSAAGLLQPRAAEALQDKLIARGYLEGTARSGKLDGKTQRALREFQREQGLPATGTPDDLTVEKLGLSPNDLFRSAGDGVP